MFRLLSTVIYAPKSSWEQILPEQDGLHNLCTPSEGGALGSLMSHMPMRPGLLQKVVPIRAQLLSPCPVHPRNDVCGLLVMSHFLSHWVCSSASLASAIPTCRPRPPWLARLRLPFGRKWLHERVTVITDSTIGQMCAHQDTSHGTPATTVRAVLGLTLFNRLWVQDPGSFLLSNSKFSALFCRSSFCPRHNSIFPPRLCFCLLLTG